MKTLSESATKTQRLHRHLKQNRANYLYFKRLDKFRASPSRASAVAAFKFNTVALPPLGSPITVRLGVQRFK